MKHPLMNGSCWTLVASILALVSACSDSSSGEELATGQNGLELESLSVPPGAKVELNRAFELVFSRPVDFATVSLNTIQIRSAHDGSSATGSFRTKDGTPRVIVFEPTPPVLADLSDAGLEPATDYSIYVPGRSSGASNTLRSIDGALLEETFSSSFFTPASTDRADLFLDAVAGPPVPVLRTAGSNRSDATRVELGGDAANPAYFELDAETGEIVAAAEVALPLNLHGDLETRVAFELFFNQMISPAAENLGNDRLRLEFRDTGGRWQPLATRVELVSNGATPHVRLEPIGALPGETKVRAVVLPGFEDAVGQAGLLAIDGFAEAPTGDFPDTLADTRLGGSLELGAGGSGDDFDWYVRSGEIFFFDTTSASVVGGPDGVPTTLRNFVNGVVDVRDLVIEEGGEIRVQGPNPMQINASRNVIIRGQLDLSGFQGRNVATLNTGNQPEMGGAGVAGGGNGGNSSENTTGTTLQGGTGLGAFQAPGLGGEGGESQFAPAVLGKDARRPGGGGGGRFALDACDLENDPDCNPQGGPFLAAEDGYDGHPDGTGAITGMMPAMGGAAGASVFVDGDPSNDFFGVGFAVDASGQPTDLITGELPALWAGAGGGGGGEAIPGVIDDPWTPASDEKGGPGGGASGGLHVRALGEIVFGRFGLIRADGARGGTGENTIFLDHVGGSGGAGSGGHVVLESAVQIDFTDGGTNLGAGETTWISARGGFRLQGPVTSGGPVSFGGAGGPGVIQLHVPKPTLKPGPDPDVTNIVVPFFQAAARDPLEALATTRPFALFPRVPVAPTAGWLRNSVEVPTTLPGLSLAPASADFLRVPRRF